MSARISQRLRTRARPVRNGFDFSSSPIVVGPDRGPDAPTVSSGSAANARERLVHRAGID